MSSHRFPAAVASVAAMAALAACEPEPGTPRDGPDSGGVHEPPAAIVPMVGEIGRPCPWPGWLGCSGFAQKGLLVCDEHKIWRTNGACPGNSNCDTTPGPRAGSCQPILPQCYGRYQECDGDALVTCNRDDVGFERTLCPEGCVDGVCVECREGASVCVGHDVRICTHENEWRIVACTTGWCADGKCP